MFDIVTISLLTILVFYALYLTGVSLQFKGYKGTTRNGNDFGSIEEKLNSRIDLLFDVVTKVELNTMILLDKKADERIKKLEDIVVDLNGKVDDHCRDNDRDFKLIIEESSKLSLQYSSTMEKMELFDRIDKMKKQGNIPYQKRQSFKKNELDQMRQDINMN